MELWWSVVLIGGLLGALYVAARRAITVVYLEVDDGKVRVVRGGVAPPVLADLRDVARQDRIRRARIRVVRDGGRADVQIQGDVSAASAQRIRNVVGSVPLARLVNAKRRG